MSEQDNVQLMRRWFQEVWNEGRLETADELLAPDGVAHDLTGQGVEIRGPEEFKNAARTVRNAVPDMRIEMQDIVATGDRVAMRLEVTMTHTGALGDLAPTGARVTSPVLCIVQIRDGKLVEGWNFWDIAGVLKAAAAPPDRQRLL